MGWGRGWVIFLWTGIEVQVGHLEGGGCAHGRMRKQRGGDSFLGSALEEEAPSFLVILSKREGHLTSFGTGVVN